MGSTNTKAPQKVIVTEQGDKSPLERFRAPVVLVPVPFADAPG